MDRPDGQRAIRSAAVLVAITVVVCALYFARDVLIPLALAAFFTVLCAPAVRGLERLRIGRVPSVIIVVTLSVSLIGALGWIVAAQAADFVDDFPTYRTTILEKVRNARHLVPGPVRKASEAVEEITNEISNVSGEAVTQPTSAPASRRDDAHGLRIGPTGAIGPAAVGLNRATAVPESDDPMKVELVPTSRFTFADLLDIAAPVVHPIIIAGVTIVILVFFLIYQEDLRDRIITLFGRANINVTTAALLESKKRVARYLQALALANTINGVVIGVGLYFIGVPNAALWGLLSGLFRFVPFVGPWVSALFPVAVSAAMSPGWSVPAMALVWCVSVDVLCANFIEPMLYGGRTGAAPTAILLSFIFWTWMWGAIGLLLATPIAVCLVTLGRHVPAFGVLYTLLSDRPVLDAGARFYQRILACDQVETVVIATRYLDDHTVVELCDDVVVPTLEQLQLDHQVGLLSASQLDDIGRIIERVLQAADAARCERREVDSFMADRLRVFTYDGPLDHLLERMLTLVDCGDESAAPAVRSAPPALIVAGLEPRPSRRFIELCRRVSRSAGRCEVRIGLFAKSRFGDVARKRLRRAGFDVRGRLADLLPERGRGPQADTPSEPVTAIAI